MPHTIQQSGGVANAFLFTFTQRHNLNNESGMLRFHSLNTDRQFSGARQFVHQVDLVGLGVPRVSPGKRSAREIITMYFCIVPITNAHRSTEEHDY